MGFYLTATSTTVTFNVTVVPGMTYYRLFFRLTNETDTRRINLPDKTSDFTYTVSGLSPNTSYTANVGYVESDPSAGGMQYMGPQTITTDAESTRPSDWVWTTTIAQGVSVPQYEGVLAPVTAQEWNAFGTKINAFRRYQGLANYTFTAVLQGTSMTAAIIGEAITAIDELSGHGTLPTSYIATSAAFWLDLAAALNAVP